MTTQSAYSSTHPDVLAAMANATREVHEDPHD